MSRSPVRTTVKVDMKNFDRSVARLLQLTPKKLHGQAIRGVAGRVLSKAASNHARYHERSKKQIEKSSYYYQEKHVAGRSGTYRTQLNTTKSFAEQKNAWVSKNGQLKSGLWVNLSKWRVSDEVWAGGNAAFENEVHNTKEQATRIAKIRVASRGIGRQAYYLMGQAVGVVVKVPAFVKKATYKGKVLSRYSRGSVSSKPNNHTLKMSSSLRRASRYPNDLKYAIIGMTKYFNTTLNKATKKGMQRSSANKITGVKIT